MVDRGRAYQKGRRSAGEFRRGGRALAGADRRSRDPLFWGNIQHARSWSAINPPGDVPVLDTAEQGTMMSASVAAESNVRTGNVSFRVDAATGRGRYPDLSLLRREALASAGLSAGQSGDNVRLATWS